MTTRERKTTLKGLAWRIAVAAEIMDPFEFRDNFEDIKECAFCTLSALENDPYSVFDALEQWYNDRLL